MHKRILSTIVAVSVIFTVSSSALAAPTQSQINQSKASLTQSQQKVQDLNDKIEKIDNEIETITKEKAEVDNKISKIEGSINSTQKNIKLSEDKISDEKQLYSQRIRNIYMNGNNQNYINMILSSKNFSDLMANIETIKKITDYDKNLMNNLNSEKSKIEQEKEKLSNQKASLVSLQSQQVQKMKDDNAKKSEAMALVNTAKAEMNKNKSYYDKLQAESSAAAAKLVSMNTNSSSLNKPADNRGGGVHIANASGVVAIAAQFVNKVPYVWGGDSPRGFDCSGLVMYCYAQMGVSLPHGTVGQVQYGRTVSESDLQPGDLLFYGSTSSPHHVAIYAGNGQMIEAPHSGTNVSLVSYRHCSIAKRL